MNTADPHDSDFDEFAHVAELARRLGSSKSIPSVRRHDFLSEEGAILSSLIWGDGPAEVVYLHGAGLHAHSWDSTALALGRSAIAFDLPGHGDSDWRDGKDYSPESIALPLVEVLSKILESPVVLVGQSLGGLAAIPMAHQLGSLVRGVVLIDVTPGHQIEGTASSQINEFMAGPESYASREEIIDRALEFGIGRTRQDLERGVRLNTRVRPDGRVIFKHHFARLPADIHASHDATLLWPILQELQVPIFLVRGSDGILSDDHVREFNELVPGAATVTLQAGHNVQRDVPKELADVIVSLLSNTRISHG